LELEGIEIPYPVENRKSKIENRLFVFFMHGVAAAATAEFFEFQTLRRGFLILRRYVVAFLALGALQNYVISRHNFYLLLNYSTISETVPAPTVLPPSLIAKRSPFSIAIGAINSISI
jgi:hypothetical protein